MVFAMPTLFYGDPLVTFGTYPIPLMVIDHERGQFIELTRTLAARADIKLDIVILPVQKAIRGFHENTVDVLFPAFDVYFTDGRGILKSDAPFYTKKDFIFTRKGDPLLGGILSLEGIRVGITSGYPYVDNLLKNEKIRFQEAQDDETNIRKLVWKRIDAFIGEEKTVIRAIENTELVDKVQYDARSPLGTLDAYYAFHVSDRGRRLAKTVSRVLAEMKMDGAYQKIMAKDYRHGIRTELSE